MVIEGSILFINIPSTDVFQVFKTEDTRARRSDTDRSNIQLDPVPNQNRASAPIQGYSKRTTPNLSGHADYSPRIDDEAE